MMIDVDGDFGGLGVLLRQEATDRWFVVQALGDWLRFQAHLSTKEAEVVEFIAVGFAKDDDGTFMSVPQSV